MTAQEACVKQARECHNEMVEEVRKAAIEYAEAREYLTRATRRKDVAEANFNLAINALKQYKG
jgi:hypothetical protein